jgi:hypothetical protein
MEGAFPHGKLAKRSHLQLLLNRWCITRGMQPKRRMLCLESCCYNKSHPSPKLTASIRLHEYKSSLHYFKSLIDILSGACTSFTPNQVHSLVHLYHRVMSLWFCKLLLVTTLPYWWSGVINSSKYPTWCRSLQAMSFLSRSWPQEPLCSLYQSKHHFDRTRQSLNCLNISFCFSTSSHPSSFSCAPPPFINLGIRFLFRGRAVTPRVMTSLMMFIKFLIKNQDHWLTKF